MANILELQHVTKVYPGVIALDDVSLSFEPGDREGECTLVVCGILLPWVLREPRPWEPPKKPGLVGWIRNRFGK